MNKLQKIKNSIRKFVTSPRFSSLALMLLVGTVACLAQNTAGNYEAGTSALTTVTEEIAKYVPIVVKLCYAIAGVVAVVGGMSGGSPTRRAWETSARTPASHARRASRGTRCR